MPHHSATLSASSHLCFLLLTLQRRRRPGRNRTTGARNAADQKREARLKFQMCGQYGNAITFSGNIDGEGRTERRKEGKEGDEMSDMHFLSLPAKKLAFVGNVACSSGQCSGTSEGAGELRPPRRKNVEHCALSSLSSSTDGRSRVSQSVGPSVGPTSDSIWQNSTRQ